VRECNNAVAILFLSSNYNCYEIKAFYSDSDGYNLIIAFYKGFFLVWQNHLAHIIIIISNP